MRYHVITFFLQGVFYMLWQNQSFKTQAVFLNYLHLLKTCINVMPNKNGCFFEETNEAFIFNTNISYPNMNGVVSFKSNINDILKDIAICQHRFSNLSLPITYFWPHNQEVDRVTRANLQIQGYSSLKPYTCISCLPENILNKSFNPTNDVEIIQVSTEADFDAFMKITQIAFSVSNEGIVAMKALYRAYAFTSKVKLYMAKIHAKPAAVLLTFQDNTTLGLYNGATLKAFQKQGLMAMLANHAVSENKQNCQQVVCQLMAAKQAGGLCSLFGATEISTFEPYCRGFNASSLSV